MVGALHQFLRDVKVANRVGLSLALQDLLPHRAGATIAVSLRGIGPVHVRAGESDVETLRQVFVHREYDLSATPQFPRIWSRYANLVAAGKTPVIIDAGANIGAAALWFSAAFPKAHVVAIEPDAENAALCRRNVEARANVQVVEAAIGARCGWAKVVDGPGEQAWAKQTQRSAEPPDRADGGVRVLTVAQLAALGGEAGELFLVKIDIEGFEDELFSDNTDWIDEASVVFVEPHDWLAPGRFSSRTLQQSMASRPREMLIMGENLCFIK